MNRVLVILLLISGFIGCQNDIEFDGITFELEPPIGFPEMGYPEDNPYSEAAWRLGKKLFYDPILSFDNTVSCSSCHLPELSFSDGLATSIGIDERVGKRNAPSLANIGYHPYFTREGGVPTLEMQVLVPIQEHDELDFNIVLASERLQEDSLYVKESLEAYDRLPDPFVITRALANFERSLISGNSKYDMYLRGELELNENEERGLKLFESEELKCASCHGGFNFTNYDFENNGLYREYEDQGRMRLTYNPKDRALFKTPSLRNVGITAPYMHDGSVNSLGEVIDHYSSGGARHSNQSERVNGFNISENDKEALIDFLNTLTDHHFITNEIFKKE